jgi:hypothetical protein
LVLIVSGMVFSGARLKGRLTCLPHTSRGRGHVDAKRH